ncbi:MAG: D-tyrosyl-tRNA(Tyr) deacylase [Flavobacteriales bacterium]|nr:D-tyrosyl-tRNA(Tyr) deacylase [Flavobacteriales bacterium]MBL6869742.1 D-tyrosyl-tRNA(Tyr) deacylase [Flavobacteriales bacterium]CAI8178928.1 MAG: D-aminoacyl-tRNA deacylase [Crocinitomicaceae bacterium]
MRVVVQKVKNASVKVNNQLVGEINNGLMVLAGYEPSDSKEDISWMVQKIIKMRIFDDSENRLNFSLLDVNGEILLISQFTLHASVKKGNRPSYIKAADSQKAKLMYDLTISEFETVLKRKISTGKFGANMDVSLVNNGPVTITIDSKKKE